MKRGAEPDFLQFGQEGPPKLVAKRLEMTGNEIWLNFMVQKKMKRVLMSILSDMGKMTRTLWAR